MMGFRLVWSLLLAAAAIVLFAFVLNSVLGLVAWHWFSKNF